MTSSLAAQLAQSTSLNSTLLNEKSRRKPTQSYLFTGRDADQYDLETIHALAVNAFLQLCQLNPSLRQFELPLLSDAAKATDRTLHTKEENAKLDDTIAHFLQLLGPYVLDAPTGKVIEWLVRRFRIHEFNVEAILSLFLPYHESPHFAKMVTILHIQLNTTWRFLLAYKAAAKNVPRASLVTEMLKDSSVARFAATLHPEALKKGCGYRTLTAFHVATLHDFIVRSEGIDEGTIAYLLPACLEPLQSVRNPGKDEILASYILLAALSRKCALSSEALKAIAVAISRQAEQVNVNQFLCTIVAVCEHQEELDSLPSSVAKRLLKISNLPQELDRVLPLVGVDKFINPLLAGICEQLELEQAQAFFEKLCTSPDTPTPTLHILATTLIQHIISSSSDDHSGRRLLAGLNQRYPSAVKRSARQISSDEELKNSVDQLMLSLSMAPGDTSSAGSQNDLLVAVHSFDESIRLSAVKELLTAVTKTSDPLELESIHNALLLRLLDSDSEVIETIYSNPIVITPIILANVPTYLTSLTASICSETSKTKPKRSLIRLHLSFAAQHLCTSAKDVAITEKIFHSLFVPFLLHSKPRQRTVDNVWEIIKNTQGGGSDDWMLWKYEWLAGCLEIWGAKKDDADGEQPDRMSALSFALAGKISESIMISNRFTDHLATLTTHMRSENPHVRSFAHLLARSLLGRLSGEHQFVAASSIIKGMDIEEPMENVWYGVDDLTASINDDAIGRALVFKPNSQNTLRLLQISILASLATVQRPANVVVNWFEASSAPGNDVRGLRFVEHMRQVYLLVNLSIPVVFTVHILSLFFTNLAEDSLAFLASVWVCEPKHDADKDKATQLRIAALRHGAAFLDAHRDNPQATDFQTILPSLLITLQTTDINVRQAVVDCLVVLAKSVDRPFSSVYAFDWIYGKETEKLQFLDQGDFKKYIEALVADQQHLIHDHGHARTFHELHMGTHGGKKKQIEYRRRVLCFLISHVLSIASVEAKIHLLKMVEIISDKVKMEMLAPVIKPLLGLDIAVVRSRYGPQAEDFITFLVSSMDSSLCPELNDPSGSLWSLFSSLARHFFSAESLPAPRSAIVNSIRDGLFAGLNAQRQLSASELLLAEGAKSQVTYAIVKALFMDLPLGVPLLSKLIPHLLSSSPPSASPPSKRPKVTEHALDTDALSSFSILAEVLGSKDLPASIDLISHLLEALNKVLQIAPSAQSDLSYIQQLLMLAIENIAEKITEAPNVIPSSIRLDILVEVVRVARNPQTFHQALMLIANLTRLAPDSVLHNVMPVFTFMGSNVFHRDDVYSFRVIQKTIDSIVPVMVAALRQRHEAGLSLYINSRDFLRVFTEASSHIPSHRRTNFFIHLIDVLGSSVFLPPVCILLVARSSRSRIQGDESIFSLPNSVVHHYDADLQLATLVEALKESQRLIQAFFEPSDAPSSLLTDPNDEDTSVLLTRAQTLISFVGQSVKPQQSHSPATTASTADLVYLLISLATTNTPNNNGSLEDIRNAARASLNRLLTVISATDFISAVLAMLQSTDPKIQNGALELLSERLGHISDSVRQQTSAIVIQILAHIKSLLNLNMNVLPLGASCFSALREIASSACDGEESALTTIVPAIILAIRSRALAHPSIAVLPFLVPKLGPRIIPFFRELITEIISLSRNEGILKPTSLDALRGLLVTIPTFWSTSELAQVIGFHVDFGSSGDHSAITTSLITSLAKRVPSKVLLPALVDFWSGSEVTQWGESAVVSFFDIVKRALHIAAKATIAEHTKSLFKLFLSAFELVKSVFAEETKGEKAVISGFLELVVKLNDATFRPLFRKLYDWAFNDDTDTSRQTTFLHSYIALLDFFKSLMTPYMTFLLPPLLSSLQQFKTKTPPSDYWICIVKTLTKALTLDDGVYWRDDKLRQLVKPLIDQLLVFAALDGHATKDCLPDCLVALGDCTSDDTLLKSINIDLLMHTRSENAKLSIAALHCSESLWRAIGGKLLGFVPETTTFIAECAENEHDLVVDGARKLKNAVESVAGKIDV